MDSVEKAVQEVKGILRSKTVSIGNNTILQFSQIRHQAYNDVVQLIATRTPEQIEAYLLEIFPNGVPTEQMERYTLANKSEYSSHGVACLSTFKGQYDYVDSLFKAFKGDEAKKNTFAAKILESLKDAREKDANALLKGTSLVNIYAVLAALKKNSIEHYKEYYKSEGFENIKACCRRLQSEFANEGSKGSQDESSLYEKLYSKLDKVINICDNTTLDAQKKYSCIKDLLSSSDCGEMLDVVKLASINTFLRTFQQLCTEQAKQVLPEEKSIFENLKEDAELVEQSVAQQQCTEKALTVAEEGLDTLAYKCFDASGKVKSEEAKAGMNTLRSELGSFRKILSAFNYLLTKISSFISHAISNPPGDKKGNSNIADVEGAEIKEKNPEETKSVNIGPNF